MNQLTEIAEIAEKYEKYETGMAIFTQLFAMPYEQLRAKVKDICGDKVWDNDYIWKSGRVSKISSNDEPESITITYFDTVKISHYGIRVKYEHQPEKNVVDFDKLFKL